MQAVIQELALLTCMAVSPAVDVQTGQPGYNIDQISLTEKKLVLNTRNFYGTPSVYEFDVQSIQLQDCPGNLTAQANDKKLAYLHSLATQIDGRYSGFLNFEDSKGRGYRAWIECSESPHPQCTNGKDQIPTDRRN